MSRVEEDPDVPPHHRKAGRKRWKVETKWRRYAWLRRLRDVDTWGWGPSYESERDARNGFAAHKKQEHFRAVRLLDPEGNVVDEWWRPTPPEQHKEEKP